jgi:hypothetical protein
LQDLFIFFPLIKQEFIFYHREISHTALQFFITDERKDDAFLLFRRSVVFSYFYIFDKECSSVLLQTLVCGLCHFQLSGFEHCGCIKYWHGLQIRASKREYFPG